MEKSKVKKIVTSVICSLLAAVIIICAVLFFPLTGKKNAQVWNADDKFDIETVQTVEKKNFEFKILLLSDTQLWTNLGDNKKCYNQIEKLVSKTQPDLIVLTGDNVSAFASRFSLPNLIKQMDSFEIPWATVFGNHDAEIPTNSKNWQADMYMNSEYCLFQKGPSNLYGCGNYVVNITENGAPVYSLFMFDNGMYENYKEFGKKETAMSAEQIAWYEWNVKGIENSAGRIVPSMAFSHFAQPEFAEAVEAIANETGQSVDGAIEIPVDYGFGECQYLPSVSPVKSGFVDKCRELGSTAYLFCGHDHENNANVYYDGITYSYGLKTGPSPAPWNSAKQMGGTLVTLSGKGSMQSVYVQHIVVETAENTEN